MKGLDQVMPTSNYKWALSKGGSSWVFPDTDREVTLSKGDYLLLHTSAWHDIEGCYLQFNGAEIVLEKIDHGSSSMTVCLYHFNEIDLVVGHDILAKLGISGYKHKHSVVDSIINEMKTYAAKDPEALCKLVENRVKCNELLMDDKHCTVTQTGNLGLVGVLNGIASSADTGFFFAAAYEDDGSFSGFTLVKG